ncbi:hypothetical protein ACFLTH_13120 [Bacteroidota bacterium]
MNRRAKTMAEVMAMSFLFLSLSIGTILVIEKAFPEQFGKITGYTFATINVTEALPAACNMTVHPEWNLVSFFCIPTIEDISTLTDEFPTYTKIFAYRSQDSSDPWKAYNPDMPSWVVQDLEYFSRQEGYWIYFDISSSANFFLYDSKRIPTRTDLTAGWNLVGYPTNESTDRDSALISINDSYNSIYSFNNTNKSYSNYTKGVGGDLNVTMPYQGYWINMSSEDMWVVDW